MNLLTNQSLFEFSVEEYTVMFENSTNFDVTAKQFELKQCTKQNFDLPENVFEDYNMESFL